MERSKGTWDNLKASFGFLPGIGLVVGVLLGVGLPFVDKLVSQFTLIQFSSVDAARSLLGTIATVTMSVAGLVFSVTLVAFTLASSQLSPRVLRTFQGDRVAQGVLATFLGTFIYCIVVLLRLGDPSSGARAPSISLTIAVIAAFAAFALFAFFLHHLVKSLQPATLISKIQDDARAALGSRYPYGVGEAPEDPEAAWKDAQERMDSGPAWQVLAEDDGFLGQVNAAALVQAAAHRDALVRQRVAVGDYVVPGDLLAEVWAEDDFVDRVRGHFVLAAERSHPQDLGFAVRQLSDVTLKGLSPGINDPTTAENAINALGATLVRLASLEPPPLVRVAGDGHPRLVALAPDLDALVNLGFEQVRVFAAPYPVVAVRLLELLERIGRAARQAGRPSAEVARQARLLREGPQGEVPTEGDVARVSEAYTRLHGPLATVGTLAATGAPQGTGATPGSSDTLSVPATETHSS